MYQRIFFKPLNFVLVMISTLSKRKLKKSRQKLKFNLNLDFTPLIAWGNKIFSFPGFIISIAFENSRPSSLSGRVAFREKYACDLLPKREVRS